MSNNDSYEAEAGRRIIAERRTQKEVDEARAKESEERFKEELRRAFRDPDFQQKFSREGLEVLSRFRSGESKLAQFLKQRRGRGAGWDPLGDRSDS